MGGGDEGENLRLAVGMSGGTVNRGARKDFFPLCVCEDLTVKCGVSFQRVKTFNL